MDATGSPDLKDAMTAVIGATVALGGLLLLFVGLLFTQSETLDPQTSDKTIERYKHAGKVGLWPFAGALILAVAALGYWAFPCKAYGYAVCLLFALDSLVAVIYGIWASRRL